MSIRTISSSGRQSDGAVSTGARASTSGRTELEHDGLRKFKQGWGTREEPLFDTSLGMPVTEAGVGRVGRTAATVIQQLATVGVPGCR